MLQASVGCGCPVTVMCSERVSKARALFNRSRVDLLVTLRRP